MLQFSAIVICLVILFVALRMALGQRRLTINQFLMIYAGVILGIGFIILGLTGRLHWLFALLGGVLPVAWRLVPWVMRSVGLVKLYRQLRSGSFSPFSNHRQASSGQHSQLNTAFFAMTLDHDSGAMDGEVLQGEFMGQRLSALDLDSLARVYASCQHDSDSASVLTAFLERNHPDWRDTFAENRARQSSAPSDETLDEATAREILGVDEQAGREDIIAAHRRLMQKFHPDRGGPTYLAAKINQAKDLLMERCT